TTRRPASYERAARYTSKSTVASSCGTVGPRIFSSSGRFSNDVVFSLNSTSDPLIDSFAFATDPSGGSVLFPGTRPPTDASGCARAGWYPSRAGDRRTRPAPFVLLEDGAHAAQGLAAPAPEPAAQAEGLHQAVGERRRPRLDGQRDARRAARARLELPDAPQP